MDFNDLTYDDLDELSVKSLIFDTKELGSILKAHLFIERVIDSLIKEKLKNPDSLFKNQISFNLKLDFAHSLGVIPDRLLSPIKGLNNIRNKYAHNLEYQVNLDELNAIKLDWADVQKNAFKAAKGKGIEDAVMISCLFLCWSVIELRKNKN